MGVNYTSSDYIDGLFKDLLVLIDELPYQKKKNAELRLKNVYNIIVKYENEILRLKKGDMSENELLLIVDILRLHGYNIEDIMTVINKKFITWIIKNKDSRFKNNKISLEVLRELSICFHLFCLNYEREPKDYSEFRNFIINTDEVLSEKHKKEIELLY